MDSKRLILAVAGSGKTFTLCNELDFLKRNLVIAYTNENIKNINSEIIKRYGYIPNNTIVITFDKFVYKYLIRPFDILIGEFYGKQKFKSNGLTIQTPPDSQIKIEIKDNGEKKFLYRSNPKYFNINTLEHFINKKNQYYCETTSSLVLKTKKRNDLNLLKRGSEYLKNFFDNIYVDEAQDFRNEDWKLLLELSKLFPNMLLVGDYYQHSVSGTNNSGEPFKKNKKIITYNDYIELLGKINIDVDNTTLLKSRRCSKEVCNFINDKLNIPIESLEKNKGDVIWVSEPSSIENLLKNNSIIKLVLCKDKNYNFYHNTWGNTKGNTYGSACVILTNTFEDLDVKSYEAENISKNKLYVALSRTKGDLYIIKKSDFDKVKDSYIIY